MSMFPIAREGCPWLIRPRPAMLDSNDRRCMKTCDYSEVHGVGAVSDKITFPRYQEYANSWCAPSSHGPT